jgi:hypothetical protein
MPAPRPATVLAMSALLMVASMSVVSVGSTPGRPLYGLRLAVESLTLPASGTSARFDAQITRLERRLSEAQQALLNGDGAAASDAIAAYRSELGGTTADAGHSGTDVPRLSRALDEHAILLARLGGELSGTAKTAAANALDQVNVLRQSIEPAPGDQGPGGTPNDQPGGKPGNGNGGGNGDSGGNGNGSGGGNGGDHGGGNNGSGNGNGNGGGKGPAGTPAP